MYHIMACRDEQTSVERKPRGRIAEDTTGPRLCEKSTSSHGKFGLEIHEGAKILDSLNFEAHMTGGGVDRLMSANLP